MADILIENQSIPSTPSSGQCVIFTDNSAKAIFLLNDLGVIFGRTDNASTAAQGAGFSSDTYVTNSDIQIPSFSFRVGTMIRWIIACSKTAAGTATPVYTIRIGSNRSTADTSRLAITGPAQTAAADNAVITIMVVVRSIGASGVIQGDMTIDHNLAATGFANNASAIVTGTSSGFDMTAIGGRYVGISINAGASAAWTLTQVRVEAKW